MITQSSVRGFRRPKRQRGWLRNPFPSTRRLIGKLVDRALGVFEPGSGSPRIRPATFESLEPRILLSGSPLPDPQAIEALSTEAVNVAAAGPVIDLTQGPFQPSAGFTLESDAGVPSQTEIEALLTEAKSRMAFDGAVGVEFVDLDGPYLARAKDGVIRLDVDAMGYGWFVDATPGDDAEFALDPARGEWSARPDAAAAGRIDLLTTLMHEVGHLRGEAHAGDDAPPADVMRESLGVGLRRFFMGPQAGAANATDAETPEDRLSGLYGDPLTLTPTIVWIGGASGNWNVAANWRDSGGVSRLPTASDDVYIGYDDAQTAQNEVATISSASSPMKWGMSSASCRATQGSTGTFGPAPTARCVSRPPASACC